MYRVFHLSGLLRKDENLSGSRYYFLNSIGITLIGFLFFVENLSGFFIGLSIGFCPKKANPIKKKPRVVIRCKGV